MMHLIDIWHLFTAPSEIRSVEHHFGVAVELYSLELTKGKKEIEKGDFIKATNPEGLKKQVKKDLPLVLRLSGKKVLSKKVPFKEHEGLNETAQRAFSNLDLSSLHVEQVILGNHVVVSAIRTDALEAVLKEYASANLAVIRVSLGVYGLFPILKQLQIKQTSLGFYDFEVETFEAKIRETKAEALLTIGSDTLEAIEALSYVSGIVYLTGGNLEQFEPIGHIDKEAADWRFKTAYKRILPVAAIGLLCLLLLSFLTFNQYYSKNQNLQTRTAGAIGAADALKVLNAQVSAKEEFLKNNAGGGRKLSEYSDLIGASLPKVIALEQMILFPLEKALKREQLFEFSKHKLELKGTCTHYADFQTWMETLNQLTFVEKIEVLGYGEADRFAPETFHLRLNLSE